MATDFEQLQIVLAARDREFARAMDRNTKRIARFEQKAKGRLSSTTRHFNGVDRSAIRLSRTLKGAGIASAILLISAALVKAAQHGEKLLIIERRLEAITGSGERAAASLEAITQVALLTGTSIDTVASAFSRYTLAAEEIGATTQEVESLTQTILELGVVGGATNQELASGAQQLGQSLAKGVLNGDELRSVMENMPLVAKAIAEGLGVSIGQLKEMGAAGELTSRQVFDALLSKADEANAKFDKMPLTVERASTNMANAWLIFSSRINESIGLASTLARVINGVAASLNELTKSEGQLLIDAKNKALQRIEGDIVDAGRNAAGPYRGELKMAEDAGEAELANSIRLKIKESTKKALLLTDKQGLTILQRKKTMVAAIAELEGRVQEKKDNQFDIEKAKAANRGREKADLATAAALLDQKQRKELTFLDRKVRLVKEAGEAAAAALRAKAPFADEKQIKQVRLAAEEARRAELATKPTGGSGGGGRSGGSGVSASQYLSAFTELDNEAQALREKIDLIGQSEFAMIKAEARRKALNAAVKAGIDLDARSAITGRTVREEIEARADEVAKLSQAYIEGEVSQDRYQQGVADISDAMAGAILAGENLRESLKRIFLGIARDVLSSGIRKAVLGEVSATGGGGGGGFLGKVLGSLFKKRAGGGSGAAGQPYLVNENTPNSEIFVPSKNGAVLNVPQAQNALRGATGGGGCTDRVEIIMHAPDGVTMEQVSGKIRVELRNASPAIVRKSVSAVQEANRSSKSFLG